MIPSIVPQSLPVEPNEVYTRSMPFSLVDWLGVDLHVRCPLCKEMFKNEVECAIIGGKWPVVGRCGHSICRKCWNFKFEGASPIYLPCPLKECPVKDSFHGRSIAPNRKLMEALDRWEDIDSLAEKKLREYESMNKSKYIQQTMRFNQERDDLVGRISALLETHDGGRKRSSPTEEAQIVGKARRVSLDGPTNPTALESRQHRRAEAKVLSEKCTSAEEEQVSTDQPSPDDNPHSEETVVYDKHNTYKKPAGYSAPNRVAVKKKDTKKDDEANGAPKGESMKLTVNPISVKINNPYAKKKTEVQRMPTKYWLN